MISRFWLGSASVLLGLAWTIPNHYVPWQSFHSDLLVAVVLLAVALAVGITARRRVSVPLIAVVICSFALVPMVQWITGLLPFFGVAWINALYLLGLGSCLILGTYWEEASPAECADFLFLGFLIASVVSVGMQLYQWLQFDALELIINRSFERPSANLGQPNQLATLLLLGGFGAFWLHVRGRIRTCVLIFFLCYCLLGIALTKSRTGWLNVGLICCGAIAFSSGPVLRKKSIIAAASLALYLAGVTVALAPMAELLLLNGSYIVDPSRMTAGQRPDAWRMFVEAVLHHPWFGYGWGQVAFAHFEMASGSPFFGSTFEQSHNLLLDLLLWNGIPLGVFAILLFGGGVAAIARRVRTPQQQIIAGSIGVLLVHAMLEYPLHYGYFLLPFGLLVGALFTSVKKRTIISVGRLPALTVLIFLAVSVLVTLRDYAEVEVSFSDLRFEKARIHSDLPVGPPNVWVLDQMREMIVLGRTEPRAGMTDAEIAWMRDLTMLYPSALNAYVLASSYALNGYPDDAQRWLKNLCRAFPQKICDGSRARWRIDSAKYPALAAVTWPEGY